MLFKEYFLSFTTVAKTIFKPFVILLISIPLTCWRGQLCYIPNNSKGEEFSNNHLYLFLYKIYKLLSNLKNSGSDISSFYVKRSIYLAFFGPVNTTDIK
jgi:hypothetical protein